MPAHKQPMCALCKRVPKALTKSRTSYCKRCNSLVTIRKQHNAKKAWLEFLAAENGLSVGQCTHCLSIFESHQLSLRRAKGSSSRIGNLLGSVPLKESTKQELRTRALLCLNCEAEVFRGKNGCSELKKKALHVLGGCCRECGTTSPTSSLQFHHLDALNKTLQLGNRGLKSWFDIREELSLCIILCANCHASIHFREKDQERQEYLRGIRKENFFLS